MVIGFNVIETIVLMGAPSFVDFMQLFIFQLGDVLQRHQEKRDREEDLEEGEELDDDDDIFDEVEYDGFSPAENIVSMYAAYSSELTALLAYPLIIGFIDFRSGQNAGGDWSVRKTCRCESISA